MRITTQYFLALIAIINLFLGSYTTEPVISAQIINTQILPTAISTVTVKLFPTPSAEPVYIVATVWENTPLAPILLYHKFKANRPSTFNKVSRLDFFEELEKLYQSGYVTVSLERWLAGDLRVPAGKRPLILSMDDTFFRNQIMLTPEGDPDKNTGLGVAWEFSQKHPDFGFHWALFSNLGICVFSVNQRPGFESVRVSVTLSAFAFFGTARRRCQSTGLRARSTRPVQKRHL